jgi:K+-sensing histidine kinase KdpD
MKKSIKEYAYSAIAFLHLGLFLATIISPEYVVIFNFKTEATFAFAAEALCHIWAALFGLYLILTRQVELSFKSWVKSIVFMLSVVSFGVILNLFLDTRCFNMNPDNYSIYFLDIFGSFEATLAAYYLGIVVVLTVGMQSGYGLVRLVDKIHSHIEKDGAPKKSTVEAPKAESESEAVEQSQTE